jgi:membrane dipeptidase
MHPIVDLHCDLLCYLANDPSRTALNREARCSLPQLREGNVHLQTMAVFTETEPESARKGQGQLSSFLQLPRLYPDDFKIIQKNDPLDLISGPIQILLAIENASGICAEDEPLDLLFERINSIESHVGRLFYITTTWNLENRFGGGAHTSIGLKDDGRELCNFLHDRHIAIDLSHASDILAYDLINYIDAKNLNIPFIASHSNFRAVTNVERNLPDELAKEIIKRDGLIGLVFCRSFVGEEDPANFMRHLEHLLDLGGEKRGCFGADFYFGGDLPPAFQKPLDQQFFKGYNDSTAYKNVIDLWQKHLGIEDALVTGIAHGNFLDFYEKHILGFRKNSL